MALHIAQYGDVLRTLHWDVVRTSYCKVVRTLVKDALKMFGRGRHLALGVT